MLFTDVLLPPSGQEINQCSFKAAIIDIFIKRQCENCITSFLVFTELYWVLAYCSAVWPVIHCGQMQASLSQKNKKHFTFTFLKKKKITFIDPSMGGKWQTDTVSS